MFRPARALPLPSWSLLVAALAPLPGCGTGEGEDGDSTVSDDDTTAADDDTVAKSACWDDLAPGDLAVVAEGFEGGTEGIAFVEGRMFVTGPAEVIEVSPDGSGTPLAAVPAALGLAPAEGGLLVADPGEFTFDGSGDDGRVWYVPLDGGPATLLAEGLPNPNFVAATPWGTALVSDDSGDEAIPDVYEVTLDGSTPAAVWSNVVPSANGLAFAADGGALFAVSTFIAESPVWRVPIVGDGAAGTPELLANLPENAIQDGVALDAEGGLFIAANIAGEIWRVDTATGAAEAVASGLQTPASLAFGDGEDWDPCSLYFTELFGDAVRRLATGREGLPLVPAIVGI